MILFIYLFEKVLELSFVDSRMMLNQASGLRNPVAKILAFNMLNVESSTKYCSYTDLPLTRVEYLLFACELSIHHQLVRQTGFLSCSY